MSLYAVAILVELIRSRSVKWFTIQAVGLVATIAILYLTAGFPQTKLVFGGISLTSAIATMLICTILGIAANYFFYLSGPFSWLSFLKPVLVSPIVLLPLIGSVQGLPQIESVQMICFGLIAFQNGFFWRAVFEHAKKKS